MPTKHQKKPEKKMTYVIGVGASAGGLEAINDFFQNTPIDTGFAFILIQHLSPDHKSLMPELLSKHTPMKVYEAEENMPIEPNSIYLLPSKKFMTVKAGRLQLQDKVKSIQPNNAIDIFFQSLAEEYGSKAIGVILSGTGTDGSKGLEAIKKKGGVAIVQDPVTATFDGMPNNAIDAGLADFILPPEMMVAELQGYVAESDEMKSFHLDVYRDESVMRDILLMVQKETGQDYKYYKRPTLFRRLSKRMMELNIPDIRDYLDYLGHHPGEVSQLNQEFLINVTYFFRDKEAFDLVESIVVPEIMKDKNNGDVVKIWSAACSSGEEAFSIAILFDEYIRRNKMHDMNLKIFATDIDREALEKASRGVFHKNAMEFVSPSRIERYFVKEGDYYKVTPELRKLIVFSFHDLLKDPPYSRMDLVLCRNMLIYVNAPSQKEIIRKLHFALNIGGFMFLGPSEYIGRSIGTLEEIDKKWRIYRTISKVKLSGKDSIYMRLNRNMSGSDQGTIKLKNPVNHMSELFRETLLEENEFAGIYIDSNFEVKQTVGHYKKYIEFPDSGLHFNLLKLVPNELSIALNIAVRKALKDNLTVSMRKVTVKNGNHNRIIDLTVKPYLQNKEYQEPFLFIVLHDEPEKMVNRSLMKSGSGNEETLQKIEELEKELTETRDNLQAVIEETEAANEELQSANEEMVSTNEELQSTNEELQSLNEELHTVSAEHQAKIKEMMDLNDDMNNYFNNSEIGQILIDGRMVIRKFSPAVTRMVNLIPSDIDRSIVDITTRFNDDNFIHDVRQVLIDNNPLEKEIILGDSYYLLRINPYLRQDKTPDGAVVNFIDITEQKKLNILLEAVLNTSPSSISVLRAIRNERRITDFEFIMTNQGFEEEMNSDKKQLLGENLSHFQSYFKHYFSLFCQVVENEETIVRELEDTGKKRWYEFRLVKLLDGLVVMSTEIKEKKLAANLIEKSYEELKNTTSQLQSTNMQLDQSNL
jgi:two-component system CheB/CheR fusion protein